VHPATVMNEIKLHLILVHTNFLVIDEDHWAISIGVHIVLKQTQIDEVPLSVLVLYQTGLELDVPLKQMPLSVGPELSGFVGYEVQDSRVMNIVVHRLLQFTVPLNYNASRSLEEDALRILCSI